MTSEVAALLLTIGAFKPKTPDLGLGNRSASKAEAFVAASKQA